MSNSRYSGKPLLRLLECYVLLSISHLPADDAANLAAMQPQLAQVYGTSGTWDQIIASTMEFPENMPTLIKETWLKNLEIAKKHGSALSPDEFSKTFVDQNFDT